MFLNKMVLSTIVGILLISGTATAFTDGYNVSGSTGAPGEQSCSCHGGYNLGSGSAEIIAQGDLIPGDTISLSAKVKNHNISRWGFSVTVLDDSNLPTGELIVTDNIRTQKTVSYNGRQYIRHTELGTDSGINDSTMWSFQWVVPDAGVGRATFYMSGLASNGNSSANGDSSYTTSLPFALTDVENDGEGLLPGDFQLAQNYPNPFNPVTKIEFTLSQRANVRIAIINILGEEVKTLLEEKLSAGNKSVTWDGTDSNGNPVASGIYFYIINANNITQSKKMVLLR